jgi:pimeloyl-ACP methyl ester carboxylesterase
MTGYFLDTRGVRLFFAEHPCSGDGEPGTEALVLIHGWSCDSSDWAPVLDGLTAKHRVVTVDLRGHGRSGSAGEDCSPSTMADDVLAVLAHLGLGQVVVVGHSAGAEVAATISVRHPGRVRAVVAIDPAYGFPADTRESLRAIARRLDIDARQVVGEQFARFDASPATSAELAALHRAAALRCRPDVAARMFVQFAFGPDSLHFLPTTGEFLRRRHAPLLAVYRNAERAAVGDLFRHHAGDLVLDYGPAGHWPHQEQPARFVADVSAWLESLATQQKGLR